MRSILTRSLLIAAAAAVGFTGAAAAHTVAAQPTDSLAWLANLIDDAVESDSADIQIYAAGPGGEQIELSSEFRSQVLSFVTGALRSGAAAGNVSVSVVALDDAGNVIYSSDELPENLDELVNLLAR